MNSTRLANNLMVFLFAFVLIIILYLLYVGKTILFDFLGKPMGLDDYFGIMLYLLYLVFICLVFKKVLAAFRMHSRNKDMQKLSSDLLDTREMNSMKRLKFNSSSFLPYGVLQLTISSIYVAMFWVVGKGFYFPLISYYSGFIFSMFSLGLLLLIASRTHFNLNEITDL